MATTFTSLSALRDFHRQQLWLRYQNALQHHWPMPCSVCWSDPDGYRSVGHICDPASRRNHSLSSSPSSAASVQFKAMQGMSIDDDGLAMQLRRASRATRLTRPRGFHG